MSSSSYLNNKNTEIITIFQGFWRLSELIFLNICYNVNCCTNMLLLLWIFDEPSLHLIMHLTCFLKMIFIISNLLNSQYLSFFFQQPESSLCLHYTLNSIIYRSVSLLVNMSMSNPFQISFLYLLTWEISFILWLSYYCLILKHKWLDSMVLNFLLNLKILWMWYICSRCLPKQLFQSLLWRTHVEIDGSELYIRI